MYAGTVNSASPSASGTPDTQAITGTLPAASAPAGTRRARRARIAHVRARIASGYYEDDAVLDLVVRRLAADLSRSARSSVRAEGT